MSAVKEKSGEWEPSVCATVPVGLFVGAFLGLEGRWIVAAMFLAPQPMILIRSFVHARTNKRKGVVYLLIHELMILLTIAALILFAFMFLPQIERSAAGGNSPLTRPHPIGIVPPLFWGLFPDGNGAR
jgi:hypothetical protein